MQVFRDYSAYFVWAGSLWLPSSFPRRKGGAGLSLLVGPAACTVCPEHPRSPSACSARCPDFWLDVVHDAEFPRPGADCFIRPWAQGVSPGGRWPSKRHNPSGIGHGGSGWVVHAAAPGARRRPPLPFLRRKDSRSPWPTENNTAPSPNQERRRALRFQEALSSKRYLMTAFHCEFSSIQQLCLFRNRRAASSRT